MSPEILAVIISTVVAFVVGIATSYVTVRVSIAVHEVKLNNFGEKLKELDGENKRLALELNTCVVKIEERTKSMASALFESKSPLSLTERGEDLLKRMGGDKFVLENQKSLVNAVKAKDPKSAYDVQEYSRDVIAELNDKDDFVKFKDFAYQEGLDLELINRAIGIFLRDIALPLLNYTITDVDDSDPSKKDTRTDATPKVN